MTCSSLSSLQFVIGQNQRAMYDGIGNDCHQHIMINQISIKGT
jgi:hypothetical protein